MRILAAEDNKTNRLVFSKLVKACDIDLTFAENGAEAVDAFLARETWSGGFIAPPPPMEPPGKFPWRAGAFRLRRRD